MRAHGQKHTLLGVDRAAVLRLRGLGYTIKEMYLIEFVEFYRIYCYKNIRLSSEMDKMAKNI